MSDNPPAGRDHRGWHADPFGRHAQRFWDGARWTERVRSGETVGIDPPGIDPRPVAHGATERVDPLEPTRPVELRSLNVPRALLVGSVLLVAIVILVVIGLFA